MKECPRCGELYGGEKCPFCDTIEIPGINKKENDKEIKKDKKIDFKFYENISYIEENKKKNINILNSWGSAIEALGIIDGIIVFIFLFIPAIKGEDGLVILLVLLAALLCSTLVILMSFCLAAVVKNKAYTLDTLMKIEKNTSKNNKDKN